MTTWLKSIFNRSKRPNIQSFTYFIPSPPSRKTGYREKQFDKVFYEFVNKGFEVLSVHTQSNPSADSPGMWVLVTVKAITKKARLLNIDDYLSQQYQSNNNKNDSETIEEIYYI